MRASPTVAALLAEGAALPPAERQTLLAAALDRRRAWLFAHGDAVVPGAAADRYRGWLAARASGTPLAYLVGVRGFWTLDLTVTPATLIPRPETEHLVEHALTILRTVDAPRILDLGTGSGAIALALASERRDARVVAVDRSEAALAVAAQNTRRLGLAGRIDLRAGSWFEPVRGERFDLVLANPPYLADHDPHLDAGDLPAEPRAALAAGPTGLEALEAIIGAAPPHLAPCGALILEHGWTQQDAVLRRCREAGFALAVGHADLAGHPRLVVARRDAPLPQPPAS